MEEAAGQVAPELAVAGEDVVGTAMLHRHAAGDQALGCVLLEALAQPVVPAERVKVVHAISPFRLGT